MNIEQGNMWTIFFWGEAFLMALFYKKKKSENQKHVSSPCSYHCKRKFIILGFKNPSLFVKQMHRCKAPCIDVKMQYDIVSLMICVSLMTIIINRVDKGISRKFLNWRVFKECGSNFKFNYNKQNLVKIHNTGVNRGAKNLHMSFCYRSRWKFELQLLYLNP